MESDPFDFTDLTGPIEVASDSYFVSLFSTITAFDTDEGIVLIDSGLTELAPMMADALRKETQSDIHTAIYTHGHVDHVHGLPEFLNEHQPEPRVIAHRNTLQRFKRYKQTSAHNNVVNARQFGGTPSPSDMMNENRFRYPDYPPDTIYNDSLTAKVGDITLELHHEKGETDDHTWIYCPERNVLCTGDFMVSSMPNAGNPQKVQRYPWRWVDALREMAELNASTMCPGHGGCIVDDPDKIQRMLTETADYLEDIVEQAIDALNDGSPPHVDIVHEVSPPDTDSPWLDQIYDEAEFVVRNVIRYYGGWYAGRPSELKPARREAIASEITELVDGVDTLLERATHLAENDSYREACHLADYAMEAEPDNPDVQSAVAEIYSSRADQEKGLMSRNLYRSAAAYAEEGRSYR